MKIYLVGGAIRDALLGIPVKDKDWLVVGSSSAELLRLGFLQVGKDFPVFLHPKTREEYALARTERKNGPGYRGFTVHTDQRVTLEEDLARRDLTVNAMAVPQEVAVDAAGEIKWDKALKNLIDPFGGQKDLANRQLRHVTSAFAEDPIRILRTARFAAQFEGFQVSNDTLEFMQTMVRTGEVTSLVSERVWQELAKGLMTKTPSRMVEVLHACGAWEHLLPELPISTTWTQIIDHSAQLNLPLASRWVSAVVAHEILLQNPPDFWTNVADRLRWPKEINDLIILCIRERTSIQKSHAMNAEQLVSFFERCDALRKPTRFKQMLEIQKCIFNHQGCIPPTTIPMLLKGLDLVVKVSSHDISQQALFEGKTGPEIGFMVRQAREEALRNFHH